MKNRFHFHSILWIVFVSLLPVFAIFVLAGMGIYVSGWLIWAIVVFLLLTPKVRCH